MAATKTTVKQRGRKAGGRKKGYYFRSGRGWQAIRNGKSYALKDIGGNNLTDRKTPAEVLDAAYKRWELATAEAERIAAAPQETITVAEVMEAYLDFVKKDTPDTFEMRYRYIYDFCSGFPPRFRMYPDKAKPKDRIHEGYGKLPVAQLTVKHVAEWCKAHAVWQRPRVQQKTIITALNWASSPEVALIKTNPIQGVKVVKGRSRITDISPEQEAAMMKFARPYLATAIKVCIRCGFRPAEEFANITAANVMDNKAGMSVLFVEDHNKTFRTTGGKVREILIPDELRPLFRKLMKEHPTGPLFRNQNGEPFTQTSLKQAFSRLRDRLAKEGIELDEDCCMYSCRHTFAKRCLTGYWGQCITMDAIAQLMGNTPEICRKHYAQWNENGKRHLRQLLNGIL